MNILKPTETSLLRQQNLVERTIIANISKGMKSLRIMSSLVIENKSLLNLKTISNLFNNFFTQIKSGIDKKIFEEVTKNTKLLKRTK